MKSKYMKPAALCLAFSCLLGAVNFASADDMKLTLTVEDTPNEESYNDMCKPYSDKILSSILSYIITAFFRKNAIQLILMKNNLAKTNSYIIKALKHFPCILAVFDLYLSLCYHFRNINASRDTFYNEFLSSTWHSLYLLMYLSFN